MQLTKEQVLDTFAFMVMGHDLTYDYSDYGPVRQRGLNSYTAIRSFAKKSPEYAEDFERIWNANVDRCLADWARKSFYWKRF